MNKKSRARRKITASLYIASGRFDRAIRKSHLHPLRAFAYGFIVLILVFLPIREMQEYDPHPLLNCIGIASLMYVMVCAIIIFFALIIAITKGLFPKSYRL